MPQDIRFDLNWKFVCVCMCMFSPTPKIFHMQNLIFFFKISSTKLALSRYWIKSLWTIAVNVCRPWSIKNLEVYVFLSKKEKKRGKNKNTESPLEPLQLLMSLAYFPDILFDGWTFLHIEFIPQFFITSLVLCIQWLLLAAIISFFSWLFPPDRFSLVNIIDFMKRNL